MAARIAVLVALLLAGCTDAAPIEKPAGVTDLCWELYPLIDKYSTHKSRHAAQLEQESSCRPMVESWDGGKGVAQFTGKKNTAWIARTYCAELGQPRPLNVEWSIRCSNAYMLGFQNKGLDSCHGWRFDEAAYNGGQGHINRERKLAEADGQNPLDYWVVREYCGETGKRSAQNCIWNREYTEHIDRRQIKYRAYDEGETICLSEQ